VRTARPRREPPARNPASLPVRKTPAASCAAQRCHPPQPREDFAPLATPSQSPNANHLPFPCKPFSQIRRHPHPSRPPLARAPWPCSPPTPPSFFPRSPPSTSIQRMRTSVRRRGNQPRSRASRRGTSPSRRHQTSTPTSATPWTRSCTTPAWEASSTCGPTRWR
jgi:hypothetical protein